MNANFRENSLDMLRLLAALQVAVLHSFEYMDHTLTQNLFFNILRIFPGVPIFFFISGFLISSAYERSKSLHQYAENRGLRLYPALWICLIVNILLVGSTGYLDSVSAGFDDVLLLFLAKGTFLQFYNPDFMRQFGDGVLNGSLWTICVELQFYVLIPVLYYVLNRFNLFGNKTLLIMIVVFCLFNRLMVDLQEDYSETVLWKLFRVSFIPWFYMFLLGVFFQRNFDFLASIFLKVKLRWYVSIYLIWAYYSSFFLGMAVGNNINPLNFFLIAALVFRFAYWKPHISKNLIRGNDYSYGIYIWHMVIVNQFVYFNLQSSLNILMAVFISAAIAIVSWHLIEKPSLRLKRFSIKN